MKKLPILCCSILISLCIAAQKTPVKNKSGKTNPANSFCNTLSKVMAQAQGQFEKIKTGEYTPTIVDLSTGEWLGEGWVASINLPGAIGSFIQPDLSQPNLYRAFFGTFQTETEAKKKLNILKKQLTTCLPHFTVENQPYMINSFQGFPEAFFFIEKKTNNSPPQVIQLYLEMDTSLYSVYLNVRGAGVQPSKYDFCSMLRKILFNAVYNFTYNSNFIKEELFKNEKGNDIGYGYKTDLIMPGALGSFIGTRPLHYFSVMEEFNSEIAARAGMEKIKNKLAACLVNYKVETKKATDDYSHLAENPFADIAILLNYEFTSKEQTGQLSPKVILQIERFSDRYCINLTVLGTGSQTIPRKPETIVQPKETTQSKLAKQLLELLDYSKDGFEAIKGEEIKKLQSWEKLKTSKDSFTIDELVVDTDFYPSSKSRNEKFKTTFLPEGAIKSEIRYYPDDKSTKFIASASYSYVFAELTFQKLFGKMKKELGDGFDYEADEESIKEKNYSESKRVVFYRKGSNLSQIELIYNIETDTLRNGMPVGILIVVTDLKGQSNVADNKPVTKDITGNETILKIWQNDKGQDDQPKLVEQLLELLAYSDKGFEAIKGLKKPQDSLSKAMGLIEWVETYHSSYALEGAEKNSIQIAGEPRFTASFPATNDTAKASFLFRNFASKIKIALGKDVSSATEEKPRNTTITFKKKGDKTTMYYIELRWAKLPLPSYNFSLVKVGEYISSIISIDVYQKFEY